ncbi:MAG: N-acetylmuramoyl-L-alanine amidase, partial [Bacteroidales bacterium]|nr:N-acetylmuramoyl-L-alanine amidase [Bacteroidales bacterium]
VECGFITNKGDAEKLLDNKWQSTFAASLANGIDKYSLDMLEIQYSGWLVKI